MGKLDKTDRAGKTVEAWWALLFADGSLGQSVTRWSWPVIGGAIGAWVASATDWISSYGVAGWAATIMLGALGTVWIAVGIDHFRSRRSREIEASHAPELDYEPGTLDRIKGVTESEVKALVEPLLEAHLAEFLDTKLRAEFVTNRQQHTYDVKLAAIKERADAAYTTGGLAFEHIEKENGKIAARISEIANGCFDLEQRLERWTRQHSDSQERRFDWVDAGFKAILNR